MSDKKIINKETFRQWMFGMMIGELGIKSEDTQTLLKLKKCTHEIMDFADETNLFVKENVLQEHANSSKTHSGEA